MEEEEKMPQKKKIWISYYDDDDTKINGYFEVLEWTPLYIKFKNSMNIITISMSRVLKIKQKPEGDLTGD